jgi:hypothetical protein
MAGTIFIGCFFSVIWVNFGDGAKNLAWIVELEEIVKPDPNR